METTNESSEPTLPLPDANELGQRALGALRTTRWILWAFIVLCILCVPYAIVQCIGMLWAAQFFDNSGGAYTSLALMGLSEIPFACVLAWQFFWFDKALARVAAGGGLDWLIIAQKRLLLILCLASVAYMIVIFVGSQAVAAFAR